jgi:hypothetical protein
MIDLTFDVAHASFCPGVIKSSELPDKELRGVVLRRSAMTHRLQAICPLIDGPPRDIYHLPSIEPLELLLPIPDSIAACSHQRLGTSGLLEPP